MNPINATRLADMTISVLERTAMVLAEPAEEGRAHAPASRFARIRYSGPTSGELVLGASEGFLRELASSLLGVDPLEVDVDAQGRDALKEMANIVGGSVVLDLGGESGAYSLGFPEITHEPTTDAPEPARSARCTVTAEGEPLRVWWREGPATLAA